MTGVMPEWPTSITLNKNAVPEPRQNWQPNRTEFRGLNVYVLIHFNHHKNEKEMREGKYAGHSGISNPQPPSPAPLKPSL